MRRWLCGILALLMLLGTFTDMSLPVRAEEATESTEVTQSTDPTQQVDATETTEPTAPAQPTDPTEPSDPTEPEQTDPAETIDSSVSTDPTEIADATEPTDTTESTETTDPTEPEPTEPPDPSAPVDLTTATSSENMIAILKTMEGFHAKPYWDVSQWTVGYGTRCPDDKLDEYKTNGITEEAALALLRKELDYFEAQVRKFATKYSLTLNQYQFDALVSFSYNRGASWMSNASHPLVLTLTGESSTSQILHDFCLYSVSQGSFILTKRRLCEAFLFLEGEYIAYNTKDYSKLPSNYRYVYLDGNGGTLFTTNYYTYIMHAYDSNDPIEVIFNFTVLPTGTDADGNTFEYTFAGWYTAAEGGDKVELLDGSLMDGTVLYAHWMDPNGNVVTVPKGEVREPLVVTVKNAVNVRSGPGTYYATLYKAAAGTTFTITETYTYAGTLWGKCEDGWLSLTYTNYSDIISGNTGDTGSSDTQWPKNGTVNANSVNIRSGPGTSYPYVTTMNKGDAVVIHAYHNDGTLEWGQLADGNWICLKYVDLEQTEQPPEDPTTPGDVNGDELVDKNDAVYLLRYVVFPDKYPIATNGDVNGDGAVDKNDAIYLLRYVVFPEKYPLATGSN